MDCAAGATDSNAVSNDRAAVPTICPARPAFTIPA